MCPPNRFNPASPLRAAVSCVVAPRAGAARRTVGVAGEDRREPPAVEDEHVDAREPGQQRHTRAAGVCQRQFPNSRGRSRSIARCPGDTPGRRGHRRDSVAGPRRRVEIWIALVGIFRSGFLNKKEMMAVGVRAKPRQRGFARSCEPVGASIGQSASAASTVWAQGEQQIRLGRPFTQRCFNRGSSETIATS